MTSSLVLNWDGGVCPRLKNVLRSLQAATCAGQGIVKKQSSLFNPLKGMKILICFGSTLNTGVLKLIYPLLHFHAYTSTPTLPCCKTAPREFEVGEAAPEYPDTVQDHYRRIYFETIDLLIAAIQEQFQQRGFLILQ